MDGWMGVRLTRRDFARYSAGTIAGIYLGASYTGCGNGNGDNLKIVEWPIEDHVFATAQRQVLPIGNYGGNDIELLPES